MPTASSTIPAPEQKVLDALSGLYAGQRDASCAAAINAIRASVKAAHPDAQLIHLTYLDEGDSKSIDIMSVGLASGDGVPGELVAVNDVQLLDTVNDLGHVMLDESDLGQWADRTEPHYVPGGFIYSYVIENLDDRHDLSQYSPSAAAISAALTDKQARELHAALAARLGL